MAMDGSDEQQQQQQQQRDSKECVKVAINKRPLIASELLLGCTDCVTVVHGEPQVQIGGHAFTYDHVYGSSGSPLSSLYNECVAPLVDALFHGYNATVLAYGQTGSGKTYTMGTNYSGTPDSEGIIPKVMDAIFTKASALKDTAEIYIRVSFIEIFKEEVFDLLDPHLNVSVKNEGSTFPKSALPSRAPIQIRETANGITLAGVTELEVGSKEEMAACLARGSLSRATGSTNMNSQSSRSHAIFTISLEQKKIQGNVANRESSIEIDDDILFSKLHLVDLAGSERAKRTGADGLRLKEGIHINRGLLALGNVISALGDEKKRKEGGHVPYRDSKLTRLLQDSLGGNSKTVMIACISPADTNAEETINTLKYANRARNIQNKAVINRDPMAAEMQRMRSLLEQYQAELLYIRGGGAPLEEHQDLRHRLSLLEASNVELRRELKERKITCEHFAKRALDAQLEKDELLLKMESTGNGNSDGVNNSTEKTKELDLVKNYVQKIQQLEAQLLRAQSFSGSGDTGLVDSLLEKDCFLPCLSDMASDGDDKSSNFSGEAEYEKEHEHSTLQEKLGKELQELDKQLEQKEAEMKQFAASDTTMLRQKLLELEQEKKVLLKEIEDLRFNLAHISLTSDGSTQKLKDDYLHKLNMLETQVSDLKKKQEAQSQLLRQKQKSDEVAKRLQEEIQRIKSQKVQLQNKIKQESEQFRLWKATREKEILQLKKEGRRNEYEMRKWMALHQRQQKVVQRKTEEAALAQKRLKELLEIKKAASRGLSGSGSGNGIGLQSLMQEVEHELELIVRVHEVRTEYERQMEERTAMATELAKLKEESEVHRKKIMSERPQTMSPGARNYRISALESMLASTSSTVVSMASQLSEAEERLRACNGRGRWNQVQSLGQAKSVMNHLFNLASSSRCQIRDKELSCREKDSLINELKSKVVNLSSVIRHLETELAELRRSQMLACNRYPAEAVNAHRSSGLGSTEDEHFYNLRKVPRPSQHFGNLVEDMDTSESELDQSDVDCDKNDMDWVQSSDDESALSNARFGKRMYSITKPGSGDSESLGNVMLEVLSEEGDREAENNNRICCSCSKSSSCKTKKCECRANGNICGTNCGCLPSKCSNQEPPWSGCCSSDDLDNEDSSNDLASRAAVLLQKAVMDRPLAANEDKRKPLCDIGNKLVKQDASKPSRRKKWRKSAIQLIPTEPLPNDEERGEAPSTKEEVPLKLPRSMNYRSVDSNPPLGDRNSVNACETAGTSRKVGGTTRQRSPPHFRKVLDEKENHII